MSIGEIAAVFKLENNEALFTQATTPRSCGGGDEFKHLALIGDQILNQVLLKIQSDTGLKNTGLVTIANNMVHNKRTLVALGRYLNIDLLMEPIVPNQRIGDEDIKEAVEALLGATHQAHGLNVCTDVVKDLLQVVKSENLFDINFKGILQEMFQKSGYQTPQYSPERVGGPDHEPLWKSIVTGNYNGNPHVLESEVFNNLPDAEKNAAEKLLAKLTGVEISAQIQLQQNNVQEVKMGATSSLETRQLIFSKPERGGIFKVDGMRLTTGTGETITTWAKKKAKKNPYGMLILLSARLPEVAGSSWSSTIEEGELVLLNLQIENEKYYEIGNGNSKTEARKDAANKVISTTNLYEWLSGKYKDKEI